jgi:hypothetical protein
MRKRFKPNQRKARKSFTKTADRTHKFNFQQKNPHLMRGGIRM